MAATRIVFMGTPEFAVPSLEALTRLEGFEIVMVVTQPDRPAGRGQSLRPSPVKARAMALGLPVWTPEHLKREEEQATLRALAPDVLVVVAYGEILRPPVLAMAPHGAINVHASLLPRHRGASPIVGALLAGDEEVGVTTMLLDEGMDTGPILEIASFRLEPGERHTQTTLTERLAKLGADLLVQTLPRWLAGEITPHPQAHEAATATRLIRKEHGRLEWEKSARALANQVRAFDPWPGSFTTWKGETLKVLDATLHTGEAPPHAAPGTVARLGDEVLVATGDGWLALHQVQLAGKKALSAREFVNGYREFVGSVVGG
ncbi:MAG: methionyl-tRNA formyltransferase [Ardenticatenales bacterium]|nr:methionyl-tRNA formyltransferase [Ardenticatenales bacterium]